MPKQTGRDLRDFTLTMRELAPLPWRQTASNASGLPTQYRSNGLVGGFLMTILQDITYYADNHATLPGMVATMFYTLEGPDVDDDELPTIKTIELIPTYTGANMTGQDVKIDGIGVAYNAPVITFDVVYTSANDFTVTWDNVPTGDPPDATHTIPHYLVDFLYQPDGVTLLGYAALAAYSESGSAGQSTYSEHHKLHVQWRNIANNSWAYGATVLASWDGP